MMTFKQFIETSKPDIDEVRYTLPRADDLSNPVTLRLPKPLLRQVDEAAGHQNTTRANYIRAALHQCVRYSQDVERAVQEMK
jgi:hypothetical protein